MTPPVLTPEDFRNATGVSRETLRRLETYAGLLTRWQPKINLVAPATLPMLWHRHFLDSAQILPLIPTDARRFIDLGSGAGFPGLILALCLLEGRQTEFHLFEADQRKAAFLREVIRQTGAPATVHVERIERSAPMAPPDVILARALAPLPKLFEMLLPFWRPGAIGLLPKGKTLDDEIRACSGLWEFAYDRVPSLTDSAATIFVLRSLSRVTALRS